MELLEDGDREEEAVLHLIEGKVKGQHSSITNTLCFNN